MGSSSKISTPKKAELSSHALTLHGRLHEALSLGIKSYDEKGRKWQCMDAEIQSHALRSMTAFIGCIYSAPKNPLVKDSVSDMLLALEGILQSRNENILNLSASVVAKLVSCLGTSIRHYPVLKIIVPLWSLLSYHQLFVVISFGSALNHILLNLRHSRFDNNKDIWKAFEKTNALSGITRALKNYVHGNQPPEYFTEMASLLKTVLWRWPPSRYHVWSDTELINKLGDSCSNPENYIVVSALQLFSTIALCGDVAMKIIESKELYKIVQGMRISQPNEVAHESLILCQQLMRSAKGCSTLTSLYGEPIVQGIIGAMGGWRSHSKCVPTDMTRLVMEACRTALICRWPGNHHSYFWKHGIQKVLLDILLESDPTTYRSLVPLSPKVLLAKIYDNNADTRPYIWDILGWLAIHCKEDFLPKSEENLSFLNILIFCTCAVAKDLMQKRCSAWLPYVSELEPVSRALLLMVFSPCKQIASLARKYLFETKMMDDNEYLVNLLAFLKLTAIGKVSPVSNTLQTVIYLIGLACYSTLPQYQKLIVEKTKSIKILSAIIKKSLSSNMCIVRSSIAPHLRSNFDGRTCCWNLVGDWEGGDFLIFYSLLALSQMIVNSDAECKNSKLCGNSEGRGLVESLQHIIRNSFSSGAKWYAAYILSFFGFYGFPTELGMRMERALNECEYADLKLILSNDQSLRVHNAILVARCPYLLPPQGQPIEQWSRRFRDEVRMSDRVDNRALRKILEYVYTGAIHVDDDLTKPLKILAKSCALKSLSDMLHRKRPTWGSADSTCDFIGALGTIGQPLSDIVLEAKSTEGVDLNCDICPLSVPHIHAHKIILCSSCEYLRGLFTSGMRESCSGIVKVPIGWKALVKLADWFYSGELPRSDLGSCQWKYMVGEGTLHEVLAYVELSSIGEYWMLEEVREASMDVVESYLRTSRRHTIEIIRFAASLDQWSIVRTGVSSIGHLYAKMRDAGDLDGIDEEVIDMLRTEYVSIKKDECYPQNYSD